MNLIISLWRGRLGNNIIQIKNCICIALYYNFNIIIPYHNYFNKSYIEINKDINKTHKKIYNETDFLYLYNIIINNKKLEFNKIFNEDIKKKSKIILLNIFKIKSCNLEKLSENDLVIHIRGGDIFSDCPNPNYICPPLSYYINIISNKKYKHIYLISEDEKNPCIEKLKKLYKNIRFKKRTLDIDIKLILRAKNIVISFGTFVPSLLILSSQIQNIYYPSYLPFSKFYFEKYNLHKVFLDDYKNKMNIWENNKKNIHIMINYGLKRLDNNIVKKNQM